MASPQTGVRRPHPTSREVDPDENWSRFDIAGFATLYCGVEQLTAYEESLAYAQVTDDDYEGLFDDEGVESVSEQWRRLGHMDEQSMPVQWRAVRNISSFMPKRADDLTTSRHGTEMECYALWVDLGNYPTGTPIKDAVGSAYTCTATRAIECHDTVLQQAARRLRLVVH
ncbi:hypothetical protein V2J52_04430 [Georgenia sp. MJ173]|uniref:hypothetical protein n=1 Tax=Georgenia sunbinii TaxID=3117728 RepID=UPI002F26CA8E